MRIMYEKPIEPYKTGERWDKINITDEDIYIANLNLGNATYYKIVFFKTINSEFFLGIEQIGAAFFPIIIPLIIYPDYLKEKLNLSKGDSINVTDWLNTQIGLYGTKFGLYSDDYCIDRDN